MKLSNSRENLHTEDIAVTQGTTSTDFTKPNKALFLQTITSNFSNKSKNNNKIISRNKKQNKLNSPFKTAETQRNRKKSIELIINSGKKSDKLIKSKIQNLLLPRNINSYTHLIRGKGVGIYAEIDWALRLRDYSHKNDETKVLDYKDYYYRKNQKNEVNEEIKQEKIKLTENFCPPSFYEEDLKKYQKKKKKEEKSLITKLNPNFFKIKHLLLRNTGDHSNISQFQFATSLRNNLNILKEKKEKEKKFQVLPIVERNNNNHLVAKFLAPCTKYGIENLKKIDKYLSKKHEYKYGQAYVEGEKIIKRIFSEDKNYTISGIGETLGDVKYNNKFPEKNIFYNKKIIETEANQMVKFELGLRLYGNEERIINNMNNRTQRNFRPKHKKFNIN